LESCSGVTAQITTLLEAQHASHCEVLLQAMRRLQDIRDTQLGDQVLLQEINTGLARLDSIEPLIERTTTLEQAITQLREDLSKMCELSAQSHQPTALSIGQAILTVVLVADRIAQAAKAYGKTKAINYPSGSNGPSGSNNLPEIPATTPPPSNQSGSLSAISSVAPIRSSVICADNKSNLHYPSSSQGQYDASYQYPESSEHENSTSRPFPDDGNFERADSTSEKEVSRLVYKPDPLPSVLQFRGSVTKDGRVYPTVLSPLWPFEQYWPVLARPIPESTCSDSYWKTTYFLGYLEEMGLLMHPQPSKKKHWHLSSTHIHPEVLRLEAHLYLGEYPTIMQTPEGYMIQASKFFSRVSSVPHVKHAHSLTMSQKMLEEMEEVSDGCEIALRKRNPAKLNIGNYAIDDSHSWDQQGQEREPYRSFKDRSCSRCAERRRILRPFLGSDTRSIRANRKGTRIRLKVEKKLTYCVNHCRILAEPSPTSLHEPGQYTTPRPSNYYDSQQSDHKRVQQINALESVLGSDASGSSFSYPAPNSTDSNYHESYGYSPRSYLSPTPTQDIQQDQQG